MKIDNARHPVQLDADSDEYDSQERREFLIILRIHIYEKMEGIIKDGAVFSLCGRLPVYMWGNIMVGNNFHCFFMFINSDKRYWQFGLSWIEARQGPGHQQKF